MKRFTATVVTVVLGITPAIAFADRNSPDYNQHDQDSARDRDSTRDRDSARDQNTPDQATQNQEETDSFVFSSSQGRLGVMVMRLTPELRSHFGAPRDAGLLVARVQPRSPASRAGIKVGDVVTSVGNTKVQGAADVISALSSTNAHRVPVEIVRQGRQITLQAPLPQQASQSQADENPTI